METRGRFEMEQNRAESGIIAGMAIGEMVVVNK
jgi:hypothetical protein